MGHKPDISRDKEQKAQFKKFELENRALELATIAKAKKKIKSKGYYCKVTKYFPDYVPDSTKIFIEKGKNEATIILNFVEKRKHYITFNDND